MMKEWIAVGLSLGASWFGPLTKPPKIRFEHLEPRTTLALGDPDRRLILMNKDRNWHRRMVICVVAHEYGHITGRWHSSNPRSIMYPRYYLPTCKRWIRLARRRR